MGRGLLSHANELGYTTSTSAAETLYNAGIENLASGKYVEALDALFNSRIELKHNLPSGFDENAWTDLFKAGVDRVEALSYLGGAVLSNDHGLVVYALGHINSSLSVTERLITARQNYDNPQYRKDNLALAGITEKSLLGMHGASIGGKALIEAASGLLHQAKNGRRYVPKTKRLATQSLFLDAHNFLLQGNNYSLITENSVNAAISARVHGRDSKVMPWLGKGALNLARTYLHGPRGDFSRGAKTYAMGIFALRSYKGAANALTQPQRLSSVTRS